MTYAEDYTIPEEILEQICEQGSDALPDLIRIMLNTAMRIDRQKHSRLILCSGYRFAKSGQPMVLSVSTGRSADVPA